MKRLLTPIFILLVMTVAGCTQNNGHIGPIFGSWALVGITEDGNSLDLEYETVFSFQNKVVQVVKVYPHHHSLPLYGNFELDDDHLSLTFLTDLTPDGKGKDFQMPDWLYFPEGKMPLMFEVRKLDGSSMVLVLDTGVHTLTYSFDRTW